MSRYYAEHSTARPGGKSLAKGSKDGSKKRGKTATKNAPTNREDTTKKRRTHRITSDPRFYSAGKYRAPDAFDPGRLLIRRLKYHFSLTIII